MLDKNLFKNGVDLYSPETCAFLPREVASMFSKRASGGGVSWHKVYDKYVAGIRVNGKRRHLGYFEKKEEARQAYDAEKELADIETLEHIHSLAEKYRNSLEKRVYEKINNFIW